MLKQIVIGGSLAFASAIQPGPLQAYLLSKVAAVGWRRTLPAAFAPLLSDGPIAFLALVVLGRLSPAMQTVLRAAGGALLLYLAAGVFRQWRRGDAGPSQPSGKVPRTIFEATLVNLLNPNPYLGWALVLGPLAVAAWRESPVGGVALVGSFYIVIVAMLILSIIAFGSARFLSPRLQRNLLFLSGVILTGLAVYQLVICFRFFRTA